MKTDLIKRVERMESRVKFNVGDIVILTVYVTPGHIGRPVSGWSFGDWGKRVDVLRDEGENDEDLRRRAVALAREHFPGVVPSLTSIG